MNKNYECCICHKPIEKGKRLVYQEYDGKKSYGAFHNIYNYDLCSEHFKVFLSWIIKNRDEDELKIGVEVDL